MANTRGAGPESEAAAAVLTAEATLHLRALARLVAPRAAALQRGYARVLQGLGYDAPRRKSLLALSPAAAAPLLAARGRMPRFLEQVSYHGRRLAKFNLAPAEAVEALRAFDPLLEDVSGGCYRPAREQLQLATIVELNQAYYLVRENETQAFFALAQAEAEAPAIDDLLRRFVGVLVRAMQARGGSIVRLPGGVPRPLRRPLYTADPARAARLLCDPGLLARGRSWWSCPVGEAAVIQLAFSCPWPWLPRELKLLRAAAERCRRAMERARLIEDLAAREQEVERLAAQARRAEEDERHRIGRELHDETGQSLLVLRLELELLERQCGGGLPRLAELRESVERNIEELRRIIAALSPDPLERLGLAAALRHLAARSQKLAGVPVRLRIAPAAAGLEGEPAQVIYRVAQEALHNAARHSRASHVNLSLRAADKTIKLSVADDGAGFDANTAPSRSLSFGLAGMRERAVQVGGRLRVRSAPGQGTAVTLELPRR